ncbi:unnamed protein product [Brassica oleracea var. botrytis]|uniref:Uncharacterized protein n=2 Tax=Brassica oleracea TaxID=3712 RepID=A0A0D3EBR8_BRAOL|nr:unnamed protein product [Brassica oleracea]
MMYRQSRHFEDVLQLLYTGSRKDRLSKPYLPQSILLLHRSQVRATACSSYSIRPREILRRCGCTSRRTAISKDRSSVNVLSQENGDKPHIS